MGKTPTKNPNLWSNDRLALEYRRACQELSELVQIAKQVKQGIYSGSRVDVTNKENLVNLLVKSRDEIFQIEKYINRRQELLAKTGEVYEFKLIKINRNPTITYKHPDKTPNQRQHEREVEADLDRVFKELMED